MKLPTHKELKKKRKELGLTQSKLAEKAGVSQPLIARIEANDVDPRLSTVRKLIQVFDQVEGKKIQAKELMTKEIVSVSPNTKIEKAVQKMRESGISQLPVLDSNVPVGSVSDSLIARGQVDGKSKINKVMGESFPSVSPDSDISTIITLLENNDAVIVVKEGKVKGIITDADVAEMKAEE